MQQAVFRRDVRPHRPSATYARDKMRNSRRRIGLSLIAGAALLGTSAGCSTYFADNETRERAKQGISFRRAAAELNTSVR
jgi:hypothetical protein